MWLAWRRDTSISFPLSLFRPAARTCECSCNRLGQVEKHCLMRGKTPPLLAVTRVRWDGVVTAAAGCPFARQGRGWEAGFHEVFGDSSAQGESAGSRDAFVAFSKCMAHRFHCFGCAQRYLLSIADSQFLCQSSVCNSLRYQKIKPRTRDRSQRPQGPSGTVGLSSR